ncbi:hypothetical protein QQM41_02765 [Acetobacter sp. AC2005]|uniref:hypothetical protein n=1 Tax=Acetobacter sp. AC2005 TaxID=3134142 RepID=UPI0030CFC231
MRDPALMWNEPYLETCCRAALHRLCLAGEVGRPTGMKDDPCLTRLAGKGLARQNGQGRFFITDEGTVRHASEVLKLEELHTKKP